MVRFHNTDQLSVPPSACERNESIGVIMDQADDGKANGRFCLLRMTSHHREKKDKKNEQFVHRWQEYFSVEAYFNLRLPRKNVARICNLPYRRLAVGRRAINRWLERNRSPRRFQICATEQQHLRPLTNLLPVWTRISCERLYNAPD